MKIYNRSLPEDFHQEKAALLTTGMKVSSYLQVDDTGARHQERMAIVPT